MRRLARAAGLVVALVLVLVAGVARAERGTPMGWAVDRATEQVVVGRFVLRYEPALEDEALWLAQEAPWWWSDIESALAGDLDDTLYVTFVDHAGRVAEATGMPRWVAGVAHSPSGHIAIARHGPDGGPVDLETLLRHEMAHVALHRATGGVELPRWLHEGVAESFTDRVSLARAKALAGAVFGPGVPNVAGLEAKLRADDPVEVSVAYAAARDLVSFLRTRDVAGAKFRQLLSELRRGYGVEAAFVRAYGLSIDELASTWQAGLPGRFVWYPLASSGGLPFFLVGPLVAWAWLRRRRVLKMSFDRLAREESPVDAPVGLGRVAEA
jgi:hypothetical protein